MVYMGHISRLRAGCEYEFPSVTLTTIPSERIGTVCDFTIPECDEGLNGFGFWHNCMITGER